MLLERVGATFTNTFSAAYDLLSKFNSSSISIYRKVLINFYFACYLLIEVEIIDFSYPSSSCDS